MKTKRIMVSYIYDIEINEDNFVVKEYDTEKEIIDECASYNFSNVLPVIQHNGVIIKNISVHDIDIMN